MLTDKQMFYKLCCCHTLSEKERNRERERERKKNKEEEIYI